MSFKLLRFMELVLWIELIVSLCSPQWRFNGLLTFFGTFIVLFTIYHLSEPILVGIKDHWKNNDWDIIPDMIDTKLGLTLILAVNLSMVLVFIERYRLMGISFIVSQTVLTYYLFQIKRNMVRFALEKAKERPLYSPIGNEQRV